MRIALNLVGTLLILTGLVWSLQGAGFVGGSFMTGAREWLWIGLACIIVGVIGLIAANRRPGRRL